MEEIDKRSYIWQVVGIIIVYIAAMFIFSGFNPNSAKMTCDENYFCRVEYRYVYNFKQTGDFYVNSSAKLRFYSTYGRNSGFVNIYGGGLNTDPFGTKNFYSFKSETYEQRQSMMNGDINRFQSYIENPKQTFVMEKVNSNRAIFFIITLFFLCFAITNRPIENLLKLITGIIKLFFGSYRRY